MLSRLFAVFAAQALGGLLGWLLWGWPGAFIGSLLASLALTAWDVVSGMRFERWVSKPNESAPDLRGRWGQLLYRTRRGFLFKDQQTQQHAARLEAFLQAIQAFPNGVVLLDAQGCIEWCNAVAAQHFGLDPQRDMLQRISNLLREPVFLAYYQGLDYSSAVHLPERVLSTGKPLKLSVQLHRYGDGQLLLQSQDVTALAQAEAMRRDFVANVSHEIRTPLTVLAGFIETMQTLPLSQQEQSTYLALMAVQSQRMQSLVSDLLVLSRLEGSPLPSASDLVDLTALMAQCAVEARGLSLMLHPADERPQQLQFDAAPDFQIIGSAAELHSAVANLINNAVRYTGAGGSIRAAWELLPDGKAKFSVTDTGCGIAPEHLDRLTERFYRVDRSRSRESGGTGLGLAITKHVALRHAGELQISSKLGKGSCFALVFPASRVHLEVATRAMSPVSIVGTRSGLLMR